MISRHRHDTAVSISTKRPGRRRKRSSSLMVLTFVAPFVLFFLAFYVLPVAWSLYLALHMDQGLVSTFVGFRNFALAFTDSSFYQGLRTVLLFAIIQIPVMLIVGVFLALLLDSGMIYGHKVLRLAMFVPYAVPSVVSALLWGYLYTPSISPMSSVLKAIGLSHVNFLGPGMVLIAIMNIVTWEYTGNHIVVFHSALQAQSKELQEAASVEGANWFQIATRIKLPVLRPAIVMIGLFSIVGTLQLFNEPYIVSSLVSLSPSFTPNMYIYNVAFQYGNVNYASALAFMLAVITIGLSFLIMRYAFSRTRAV
jgi:multiple sugar transport system permease protein